MRRILKSKRLLVVAVAVLAIVLGPYLWSRICSSSRQIQVFGNSDVGEKPASDSIRVACYNIAHGRGLATSNWEGGNAQTRLERLDEIAALLKLIDADVVVLNEVDFDASWSNHVNQAKYLADKADYPFRVEQRNLDFRVLHRTWRFGNAILSRYPVSNAKAVDLPSYAGIETALAGKKRGVVCDVQIEEAMLRVIGLHLSHRSEHVREVSARKVNEIVRASSNPCVVMGDMNSTPPSMPKSDSTHDGRNAIATFDASGVLKRNRVSGIPQLADFTFRSDLPASIIDWVFVSGKMDMVEYEVIDSDLSDHRPVVAKVRLGSR